MSDYGIQLREKQKLKRTYGMLEKQFKMLDAIIRYHEVCREALAAGADIDKLCALDVLERIARSKLMPEDQLDQFDSILKEIDEQIAAAAGTEKADEFHHEEHEG